MRYILPGMGAGSKMYSGPWNELENSHFIDWPPYDGEKSIADLANRLIREHKMNSDDSFIGSSLGGMVGLEIGAIIGSKDIILIGSAVNPTELSILSKAIMPFSLKPVVKISQLISSLANDTVSRMYTNSEPEFIVEMSKAIRIWQGFRGDPQSIVRIHGKKDRFITCPQDHCKTVADGGHLIAITHARECVDFIKEKI